jgi:hypothetical protein
MARDIERKDDAPAATSSQDEIEAFRRKLAALPQARPAGGRGRLIFAIDATASRQPTWDRACHLQAEMFGETAAIGGLDVQLVFFRGFGECKSSAWVSDAERLMRLMTAVRCLGGQTQIRKVLRHAVAEAGRHKIAALVYVGDCMEERLDELGQLAGELGMLGVPGFFFHEGGDPAAAEAFRQLARLSGGAYCHFDASSARTLRELLSAVAVFAAGGRAALADYARRSGGAALQLTRQLGRG